MGPFDKEDIPFEVNRYSGLMVKLKPDGSATLILNLSKGDPYSVIEGIDTTDFRDLIIKTIKIRPYLVVKTIPIMIGER